MEVQIYWPLTDLDGEYLLYLTSVKVGRDVSCAVQGGVNQDGLEVNVPRRADTDSAFDYFHTRRQETVKGTV